MSKSSLCVSILVLVAVMGVVNAQTVGSAQHYQPAVQQYYYGVLYPHYQTPGHVHIMPYSSENVKQNCCCPAGKCQAGPQACCAVKPCPRQAQSCPKQDQPCPKQLTQCPQECPPQKAPCPEPVAPCQAKLEPCAEACVEPFDCEFAQAMKQVKAMHELAGEAEKRGLGDVAHHLHARADEMERAAHRHRAQRERHEHLQRMHQEHAELAQAAKRQMQDAQQTQREARYLAEHIKLTEQQMRKTRSKAKPRTRRPSSR
jgi:hypothetical protein